MTAMKTSVGVDGHFSLTAQTNTSFKPHSSTLNIQLALHNGCNFMGVNISFSLVSAPILSLQETNFVFASSLIIFHFICDAVKESDTIRLKVPGAFKGLTGSR